MGLHVDYYVSLNSPWTHLGAARIVEMTARHGASLRIHPVDFGTIFPASGGLPLPKRAPQRQAYRLMELARWRDTLGIPIHVQPRFFPAREQPAASCVIAVREEIGDAQAVALAHGVLKALWENERDTGDLATLEDIVGTAGLDPEDVLEMAADPKWAERRAADSEAALARGVFGAPSYVIGEEIFWGQDRLEFVERRLAAG